MATDNKDTLLNEGAMSSYNQSSKEKCWYDECNCEDILVADCNALVEENNKGVGRYACMAKDQQCYNPKFFSSFMKKLTCQLDHIIQNICGLWDMVTCIVKYLNQLGDFGTVQNNYIRNSAVSSADFYHPITDEYDLDIYMDSVTGVVAGESDDQRRKLTDRKYRVYIRWCADGTILDPNVDNTMEFTVYHSGETYNEDMLNKRGLHWQMTGIKDGAMEMSDSIIVPSGSYVRVHITPANSSTGVFRMHQFKIEYTPVLESTDMPDCLKLTEVTTPCDCASTSTSQSASSKPVTSVTIGS